MWPALAQSGEGAGKAGYLQQMTSGLPAPMEGAGTEGSADGHLWQGLPGQLTMVPRQLRTHDPQSEAWWLTDPWYSVNYL